MVWEIYGLDRHKAYFVTALSSSEQEIGFSLKPVIQDLKISYDLTVIEPKATL